MNWLTAAWAALKGTPKLTDDIFDKEAGILVKAGGFINDLDYSDQEKARDQGKLADNVLKHVEATAGENTVKSKTRRELAVKWINLQINLVGVQVMCVPLAVLSPKQGVQIFNMMLKITLSWLMVGGTVTVMAYFFGTYGWGTYVKGKS